MDEEVLRKLGMQQIIIDESVRYLIYARKLSEENHSLFYSHTSTAFYRVSIINWCIVFGSRNEDLHWSKVQPHFGERAFSLRHILDDCNIEFDDWATYHERIRFLRDQFLAHFDINSLSTLVPSFDILLQTSVSYRNWIIHQIEYLQNSQLIINRRFFDTEDLIADIEHTFNSK
ncbi:hypothetical protein ACOJR9_11895 [Alteromonas sp. A081]|uniref:hypothetical protein n=1 Tax=Alteromonas sp. A081 TaxID=3410269 RepID=UPI003B97ECE1